MLFQIVKKIFSSNNSFTLFQLRPGFKVMVALAALPGIVAQRLALTVGQPLHNALLHLLSAVSPALARWILPAQNPQ